jgi:hypothetical protein
MRDFYVTMHGNIFNPHFRCFHTKDGKFLRRVDIDEGDYLREVLEIYPNPEEIVEPKEVPGIWNFLFEVRDKDNFKALVFTKKNKNRSFKALYLKPNVDTQYGYIRSGLTMTGFKIYNAKDDVLEKLLSEYGERISQKDLIELVKTFSKGVSQKEKLRILKQLKA